MHTRSASRRRFLRAAAFGAAGLSLAACAAPASPTATSAPPKAAPSPAAKPSEQPTTAAKPAAPTPAAPAPTKPPATPKTLIKARLAFPTPSITAAVYHLGKEKGYFREEGVDLDLQQIPSANAIKGMLAGELEFTSATGTQLASIISGAPMKVILLSTHGPIAWLYARSEIKSVADLRGKNIAITAPGDFSDNLARAALTVAKLNPDTDVTYVAIPGASRNRFQAVVAGSADAAILTPPENIIADQQKLSKLLFLSDQVKIPTDGAGTTDALIKEKLDLVRGFARGGVKALKFLKANKAGAVPLLAPFMNIEPAEAAAIYDAVISGFTDDGLEGDEVLRNTIEDQKRILKATQDFPIANAYDLSFTKQAAQELQASGWKPQ